jgi:FkbM family methyltransferase
MILTTKTKVGIARVLYRLVRSVRGVATGDSAHAVVDRRGIRWALDLNEGIDLSIFLFGAFERSTVDLLKNIIRSGDTVIDIGANVGAHTLPMARAVGPSGKVIAFEPTEFAFRKLMRNLRLNPDLEARVDAEQVMLVADADAPVEAEIYSSWPLDHTEHLHEKHFGQAMSTSHARAERLDDYAARTGMSRVDVIKLDVDGHETQVMIGAEQLLRRFHPKIVMELSPYVHQEGRDNGADAFESLIKLLGDLHYSMCAVGSSKNLPLDPQHLAQLVPDGAGINVLLSPPA